jgi:hypothetical protein
VRTMEDGRATQGGVAYQDMVADEEQPDIEPVETIGERPEADVLEQATLVRAEQAARRPVIRDDVPEADAWEQSIEEPIDDERF